mmetsp:Transcript_1268/g.135  ORF Transcript_1268/g.135 Transcript_1268/m.135 type:complete len:81 (-) Transcript_1268:256-498(-)
MKMDLTGRDLDLLEEYFLVPPDLINYIPFVQICETVFTQPNLERDPLRSMEGAPDYLDPKDVLNADEERELWECLEKLAF